MQDPAAAFDLPDPESFDSQLDSESFGADAYVRAVNVNVGRQPNLRMRDLVNRSSHNC